MRVQSYYWLGLFGSLCAILLLFGCQPISVNKETATARDIDEMLQSSSDGNYRVKQGSKVQLPEGVKKALMPNITGNQAKTALTTEKRFDLYAEDVPAKTFFLSLVEGTPFNITVHPSVEGKISLQLKRVTVPEVLDTVRSVYGYDFRETAQGVEILPATLQTRAFSVNYLDLKRDGASEIQVSAGSLSSSGSSASNTQTGTSTPISQTNTPAQGTGTAGSNSNTINSMITTSFKADFWKELQTTIETLIGSGEGRKVAVSPLANLVVVQAMPEELKRVEDFLKSAETSLNRQVILEAKILEVQLNDSFQAGINWSMLSGRIQSTLTGGEVIQNAPAVGDSLPILNANLDNTTANVTPGQGTTNFASNTAAFGGVFALAMNYKNVGAFLELLGTQGKVQVLSSPRISTTNNQKALIKVGDDRFFITNISTTTTASAATTATTPSVTFDSFFSGIALDVTPQITDKNVVTLHIHPTVSNVEDDIKNFTLNGQAQSYPLAKSTVRESDTMVRARNGEMVIIGGLMQNQNSTLTEGIPILKDLPFFGKFFRHAVQSLQKSELVILLRPIVVDGGTWSEKIDNSLDRFRKMNEEIVQDENRYHCKGPNC